MHNIGTQGAQRRSDLASGAKVLQRADTAHQRWFLAHNHTALGHLRGGGAQNPSQHHHIVSSSNLRCRQFEHMGLRAANIGLGDHMDNAHEPC